MSADVLRQAAALMRERAEVEQEIHPSPWREHREDQWEWSVRDAEGESLTWTATEHIASWHPAVALAVADWLDAEAATHSGEFWADVAPDVIDACCRMPDALDVARAYLGSEA